MYEGLGDGPEGAMVGVTLGTDVGGKEGTLVGLDEGVTVGIAVGIAVGATDRSIVGDIVVAGDCVDSRVGEPLGALVRSHDPPPRTSNIAKQRSRYNILAADCAVFSLKVETVFEYIMIALIDRSLEAYKPGHSACATFVSCDDFAVCCPALMIFVQLFGHPNSPPNEVLSI